MAPGEGLLAWRDTLRGAIVTIPEFSRYRLYITKTAGGGNYVSLYSFGLYEEADHSGVDLCLGATASASSAYASNTVAQNAIDGSEASYWESSGANLPHWIAVDLGAPKPVRSMYLRAAPYDGEQPRDFLLQGSNDGAGWTTIAVFTDWALMTIPNPKSAYERLDLRVGGVSKLDTGEPSSLVLIFDWSSHALVFAAVPSSDGSWTFSPRSESQVLVTHIGPSGYQPWSDGPVTPAAW